MKTLQDTLLILLFGGFAACSPPTDYDLVEYYFESLANPVKLSDYDYLVVVNEKGTCLTCNNTFAKVMAKYIGHHKTLFLISSEGVLLDISGFFNPDSNNVVFDPIGRFNRLGIVSRCAIVHLGEASIDSIIEIDLNNIEANIHEFDRTLMALPAR